MLNPYQKITAIIGILVIVFLLIYPSWICQIPFQDVPMFSTERALIWNQPNALCRINSGELLTETLIVSLVALGIGLLLKHKRI